MAIPTNIPTNVRRPGVYPDFRSQVGQSLVPLPLRCVIVAEQTSAGLATTDGPVQIFSERDADVQAGLNSLGAILCRTAIQQGIFSGATPEIWYFPLTAPSSGAAATWTITVNVTGTVFSGTLPLAICGRSLGVGVGPGDGANTIAANINAQIAALGPTVPFTSSVSANVVTLVFTTKGVNGNDATISQLRSSLSPAGVSLTIQQTVTGAGTVDITNAIQSLYDKRYWGVSISNHTTTDIATLVTERLAAWLYTRQNYRFLFVGERGSLGTAQSLAAAANDLGIVVGAYEGTPSMSGEIAVCDMIAAFATEQPNANLDNQTVALYQPPGSLAFTGPEIESALGGGCTPHEPDGSWSKITRLVTTYTSVNGASSETYRDIAYPRTQAYRAEQVSIAYRQRFPRPVFTPQLLDDVRDMIIGVERQMETANMLVNVDALLDRHRVERDPGTGRLVDLSPFMVAAPVHQLIDENVLYL
jgi:phage tail sheath gpL-like